jgi:hypothetical protein
MRLIQQSIIVVVLDDEDPEDVEQVSNLIRSFTFLFHQPLIAKDPEARPVWQSQEQVFRQVRSVHHHQEWEHSDQFRC